MSEAFPSSVAGRTWLIPAALLLLAGLFPPETRPESMIGCCVLCVLGALLLWPGRLDGSRALSVVFVVAGGVLWALTAASRGALLVFTAQVTLALAVGWILFCVPKDHRSGPWLTRVLAASGTCAALHALYQKLWGLETLAQALREGAAIPHAELILVRAEVGRAFASFVTPAALGGYLVLTLTVLVGAAAGARGLARVGWAALAIVQLIGIVCSESVTAVLAVFGALGLAALAGRIPRRIALLALALVAVLVTGVLLARGEELLESGGKDTPWSLRAKNFRIAAEMIEDHPLTGVGPGGFGEHYPQYRRPGDNETRFAHNLPLQLSAEFGVPVGLLASLAFFFLFCGPLFRRSVESTAQWCAIEIGLAAFALQNLADFTAFLPSILWTAVLLRVAVARRDALAWSWPSRLPALAALMATLLVASIAAATAWAENDRWAAQLALAAGDRAEAGRLTRQATRHAPWDPDGWIAQAQWLMTRDHERDREEALGALEEALSWAPVRPLAHDLRGRVRFAVGDYPGAYVDALDAAELYPMDPNYRARVVQLQTWLRDVRAAP